MKYVTTAILLLLTLVMGVYAMVHEPPEAGEGATEEKRVFDSFDPKQAKAVVWQRGDEKIRLEKKNGKWRVVSPIRFPASEEAVATLLTDLETLIYTRRIEDDVERAEYELTEPQTVVRVEGVMPQGKAAVLRVGGQDLTERNVYVARGGSRDVLVVGKHIVESTDKTLSDLRDPHALLFDPVKLERVDVISRSTTFRVAKRDGSYSLVDEKGDILCRAHQETVDGVIRRIEDLETTRFVADGKAAFARHGLAVSRRKIAVQAEKERTLVLGGPCVVKGKTYGGEVLAGRREPHPVVFCVRAEPLQKIFLPREELRAIKLLTVEGDSLSEIRVSAGDEAVVVEETDEEGWVVHPGVKKDAQSEGEGESWGSEIEIVSKFVDDIQAFTVLGFAFPDDPRLSDYGLAEPKATIRFDTEAGKSETLQLGGETEKHVYVRRKGEKAVLMVHKELARWFRPDVMAFRERRVLEFDRLDAKRIVARSTSVTEEAVEEEGEWKLTKPISVKADRDVVRALLRTLSSLRAERYVSRATRPEFGFGSPTSRQVRCVVEKSDALGEPLDSSARAGDGKEGKKEPESVTHELEIGGDVDTGRGCYGRLLSGDGWVFVLDELSCENLRALLATREIVDVTPAVVRRVTYFGAKTTEELEKRGPQWHRKAGPKVENTQVESLLSALDNLRASRVLSYGKPGAEQGAEKPYLSVTVENENGEESTVVVGKELVEDGEPAGRIGWREGRGVVYVIPSHSVKALEDVKF